MSGSILDTGNTERNKAAISLHLWSMHSSWEEREWKRKQANREANKEMYKCQLAINLKEENKVRKVMKAHPCR